MKLKFEENDLGYVIYEDGVNTEKVTYERVGIIVKKYNDLFIDEDYSGILSFEEVEQIYNFMNELRQLDITPQNKGVKWLKW